MLTMEDDPEFAENFITKFRAIMSAASFKRLPIDIIQV